MDTIKLEKKWGLLNTPSAGKLETLRIDTSCQPDLNIGLNDAGNRCLVLYLKKSFKSKFVGEEKENIKTSFDIKNHCIVLELLDNLYNPLFNDLIISLYLKIKDITDIALSTNTFVSTINGWSAFFENNRNTGLSDGEVKGLFGEMKVLVDLLTDKNSYGVDDVLKGWTGPYDKHYDFCFEDVNIEVKTKNKDSNEVKISSSYQLDTELGKGMSLNVVSVNKGHNSGENLEDLFNEIRDLIKSMSGDQGIFLQALSQKGLTNVTIKKYNHIKFVAIKSEIYDCNHIEGKVTFPRIVDSRLSSNLSNVRYAINLHELDSFIVTEKKY